MDDFTTPCIGGEIVVLVLLRGQHQMSADEDVGADDD